MVRLIVHADDFGLSEKVNDGILQAHRHGILTSASITATGAAFKHAIDICQAVPTLDTGIHLTLVEERPVLDAEAIPSLVDGEGRLHPHAAVFFRKYLCGRARLEEIRRELEAQVQKVLAQGIRISHLDSHQHLHMLPGILRMTVDLAREYAISAIRLPAEHLPILVQLRAGSLLRILHMQSLNFFCTLGKSLIQRRTDYFFGFLWGGNLDKKHLWEILNMLPPQGTCELMCHPGYNDAHTDYEHWRYRWQDELAALTDPEIADFVRARGIQLINYRELGRS